jgi:WD40 repeat protein
MVISGGQNGARVWSVATGEPITPLLQHSAGVLITQFSTDGRQVLSASADGTVQVWDAKSGKLLGPPLRHAGSILAATFDRAGRRVLTACTDHTVRLWELESHPANSSPAVPAITESGLLQGGRTLLAWRTPSGRSTFGLWDTTSGKQLLPPVPNGNTWSNGACSADQKTVCVWRDDTLLVAEAASGKPFLGPLRLPKPLLFVSLSPDGRRMLTVGKDGTVEIRETRTGVMQIRVPSSQNPAPIGPVKYSSGAFHGFTPDGRRVGLVGADHSIRMWDASTGEPVSRPMSMGVRPIQVALDTNGRYLVTHLEDGAIRFWDSYTGRAMTPVMRPPMLGPAYHKWKFSADGHFAVAYVEGGSSVRVWNVAEWREVPLGTIPGEPLYWAGFSPDARRVAVLQKRRVRFYSTENGQPVGSVLRASADMGIPVFAPDGSAVAIGTADGRVTVWNSFTGTTLTPPLAHPQRVGMSCFSPDGWRLATACDEGTIRLWDTRTGELLGAPLPGPVGARLEFSTDGHRLFSANYQELRAFRVEPERRPIAQLSALAVLLSGQRADRKLGFVSAEPEQLRRAWNGLQYGFRNGSAGNTLQQRSLAGNAPASATSYRYGARVADRSVRGSASPP